MKKFLLLSILWICLGFIVAFLCGCSVSYLRSADTKFFRAAIGNRTDIGTLSGGVDTNGVRHIHLRGVSNDQVDGIREAVKGAAAGAVGALIP